MRQRFVGGTETIANLTTGTAMRIVHGATILAFLLLACPLAAHGQRRMLRLPPTKPLRLTRTPPVRTARVHQQPALNPPTPAVPQGDASEQEPSVAPPPTSAWWEHHLADPQRPEAKLQAIRAEDLIRRALLHSDHVLAVSEGPRIREQGILNAVADFDLNVFFDTRWDDTSDPVGNTLTTGGPDRFTDNHWQAKAGMRQKTWSGGTLEAAQELGLQDTNSLFFIPDQQAATRVTLSFNQPLLKRGGREYNESLILIAEIQTSIAEHELVRELQDHAYDVVEAYWDLYLQRALVLQRRRAHQQAIDIMAELQSRRELDSLRSQIARARAAVAIRRAALQRAQLGVRTSQARIVSLTNDPTWRGQPALELTPLEAPAAAGSAAIDLPSAFQNALHFRPEVAETMERVREAQVRLGMSKNELLPTLDFVLEAYVAGLDGDYDVANSFRNQFNDGAPSYGAGLIFEVPIGNRAAKADFERRNRELSQLIHELNAVFSQVSLEVEVAVADVEAAKQEMQGRFEALIATDEEVRYLHDRWRLLPGEDRAVSFVLEELLDAQDRQMEAEAAFVRAQVDYTLSHYRLRRAIGSLLFAGAQPYSSSPAVGIQPVAEQSVIVPTTPAAAQPSWRGPAINPQSTVPQSAPPLMQPTPAYRAVGLPPRQTNQPMWNNGSTQPWYPSTRPSVDMRARSGR